MTVLGACRFACAVGVRPRRLRRSEIYFASQRRITDGRIMPETGRRASATLTPGQRLSFRDADAARRPVLTMAKELAVFFALACDLRMSPAHAVRRSLRGFSGRLLPHSYRFPCPPQGGGMGTRDPPLSSMSSLRELLRRLGKRLITIYVPGYELPLPVPSAEAQ